MRLLDHTGQVFGRLTVQSRTRIGTHTAYVCKCSCGTKTTVRGQSLRRGETKSCGCARSEKMRAAKTTHGDTRSATYICWRGMLARCYTDKGQRSWKHYGGRGITVCERWHKYENFLADMGHRPGGLTLDRIDVNGNYEPGNCRWATWLQQGNNKRNSKNRL